MYSIFRNAVLLLLLATPLGTPAQGFDLFQPPALDAGFLEANEVFQVEPPGLVDGQVRLQARIAPGYYLYRHRLKLVADGNEIPLSLPRGQAMSDEFFGDTEVYRDTLQFALGATSAATATLHWQGCADAGICYPPQTLALALPPRAETERAGTSSAAEAPAPAPPSTPTTTTTTTTTTPSVPPAPVTTAPSPPAFAATAPPTTASTGTALAEDQAFAQRLAASGPVAAALVFFGLGLLLAFTPCVLPMIPIVSSLVVGGRPSPMRALALSTAYVLPMALTYSALGVAAGLSGANVQAALQSPWLLGAFALLFVVLAAAMFGAFELQLPAWLRDRLDRASRGQAGGTLAGAATLGVLSAVLVGPCMTAPLAGALLYIGQSGDPVTGGLALFTLGLGMGIPLLLIAVFGARVLPAPGPWMERVKAGFGFVLLGMAVYMAGRALPAPVTLALWGAWLMGVAAALLAFASGAVHGPLRQWGSRTAAAVLAVWAVAMILGGASGAVDPWRPLQPLAAAPVASTVPTPRYTAVKSTGDVSRKLAEAGRRGQWTLVDFYADWCVSCHVIEREVFGDPAVAARLARMQVLRPDVTANDARDRELMSEWGVAGPPTLMLVGPDGRERRDLRTVGEIGPAQFLERLDQAGAGEENG